MKTFTVKFFVLLNLLSFLNISYANQGTAIFDIKARILFPGTGEVTPSIVNSGENLSGIYTVTLSNKWPSKVRVTPAHLPSGMSVDSASGCGQNPILSPGQSCQMKLNYVVPSVTKSTLINEGPIVCTSPKLVHCSQPNQQNRLNMRIDFKPTPNILLKGLQSLLLGNNTGNLNQWFKINQAEDYNGIGYGNGRWIIVGSVGANNTTNVLTSTDGLKWTPISVSGSDTLFNVYYASDINEWLLSGANGILYHSIDGLNFTRVKLSTGNNVSSVFYSPANSTTAAYWVAMTGDALNFSGGKIFTSTDGTTWQEKMSVDSPYTFVSMSTNPQGQTVVLSRQFSWAIDAKVATSPDGVNWTLTNFPYPANEQYKFNSVVWDPNHTGNWIVVGRHRTLNGIPRTGNLGLQTTTPAVPASYTQIAALSNNLANPNIESSQIITNGSSVLTALANNGYIFYSSNGGNWTKHQIASGLSLSNPEFGLADGVQSLSLLNESSELYTAPLTNLNSWQKKVGFPSQRLQNSLLYSAASPSWFSVGNDNSIYSSSNGLNWQIISQRDRSSVIPSVGSVFRSTGINQWLMLAQQVNAFNGITYSSDGIVWTKATLPSTIQTQDYLWSADFSATEKKYLLIGTSYSTGNTILLNSIDGKNWEQKNSNLTVQSLRAILWNDRLKQWVAAGDSALLSSIDGGANWVSASGDPINNTGLRGIAWSSDLNQYLVVGRRSGVEVIYQSTDGLNWVRQTFNIGFLREAAYSPSKNLWVVVGFGGVIMTSPDGTNWTRQTWKADQADYDLWTVQWDKSLNLWIASGGSSTSQFAGNILIYSSDGVNWTVSTNKQLYLTSSLAIKQ